MQDLISELKQAGIQIGSVKDLSGQKIGDSFSLKPDDQTGKLSREQLLALSQIRRRPDTRFVVDISGPNSFFETIDGGELAKCSSRCEPGNAALAVNRARVFLLGRSKTIPGKPSLDINLITIEQIPSTR